MFAFMLGILLYTIVVLDGYIHVALAIAGAFAAIIAKLNGYTWAAMEKSIIMNLRDSMQALLILLTVGVLIATWIAGGIIQTMIYYGLMILHPSIFLVASVLLCAVISLATGSSWTTAGTVGIALIGIATALDISLPMTAGAIISGAYFGDKMSPLSDSTNLAAAMGGSNLFDHVKHMLFTVTPSLVITLVLFGILGAGQGSGSADMSSVTSLMADLKANFFISPILFIPPLCVILLVVFKIPALPGLFGGALLGVICACVFQGAHLGEMVGYTMYSGFVSETGNEMLDALLTRGGLESMFYSASLMISAMVVGGVLDASNMLRTIVGKLLKFSKKDGSLVLVTIFSCIFINITAADQYVAIVLPGKMFRAEFENRKLKNVNLSRILEDAGTVTSPLVPWTTCGAYMASTLGVATLAYLPFAFLCILNPIISAIYGFTGFSMKKMSDEEYDQVMKQRKLDEMMLAQEA
ncbi:Na+/H+ antiporter NhaC [Ruminococcaceae bacterium OttesenSCG-928-A11]|nr:Na+/H+ antiporter NhaC [Ruminococcaceae bacterium OttesenSCG-928-A11]